MKHFKMSCCDKNQINILEEITGNLKEEIKSESDGSNERNDNHRSSPVFMNEESVKIEITETKG